MSDNWIEQQITKSETYLHVLERLSKRKLTPGPKTLPLRSLLTNPDQAAKALAEWTQITHSSFEAHKRIELRTDQKIRVIYTSSWPDRVVLMALQALLMRSLEPKFSKRLYSFRKGRGTYTAHLALHRFLKSHPKVWIAKRDVTDYGDSISQSILWRQIESQFPKDTHPNLHRLLLLGIRPEYFDSNGFGACILDGIPTGSPLTPVLENLFLMELDQQMDAHCDQDSTLFYARYGDDFIFASADEQKFLELKLSMDSKIEALQLHYKPEKKIDLQFGAGPKYLEWLGASFSAKGKIAVRPKHFKSFSKKFKVEFLNFLRDLSKTHQDLGMSIPQLKTAIHQFLSLKSHPHVFKLTFNKNHPQPIKTLDTNIRLYLVRWISHEFKVNKSTAWKILRTLDIPSLNFQRRMRWRLNR